ncbi:MAG: MFS transporter [Firmicutes bacterium]|nr:MFS transporter [Bacillota bacterium]
MQIPQESVWSRDFTLHWLTNFLMAMGFYFLLPTIPVFALKALGADKSQVGYIIGVYTLSAVAIRPFAGYALDSIGRKKVFLWALGFFALFIVSYYLAVSLIFLLVLRLLHGFTWGATTTGGGTIAADILPPSKRGEGIGYFGLSMTLAMALGPMAGLWLMDDGRYGRLFFSAATMAALAFFIATLVRHPKLPLARRPLSWSSFVENRVMPVCIATFFATLTYGGIVSFITIYSEEIGVANGGLFFLVYAVVMSLVRPFAGKVMDRRGPGPVVITGFLSLIAGFLILWASNEVTGFTAAAVLIGIGNGNVWPTLQTMVINIVEPQRRGVANSTFFSSLDLGIGIGSIALGWLAEVTSTGAIYLASALILIIPLAYLSFYAIKDYNSKMARGVL